MLLDDYILTQFIGKGTFGEVFYTTIQGDNTPYATKKYDREKNRKC